MATTARPTPPVALIPPRALPPTSTLTAPVKRLAADHGLTVSAVTTADAFPTRGL